jgi:hypothetical protein
VRTPFIDLINNNNYNFKHLDIREQFIWLMSNEDNFIINQLSDMILKLHSSRQYNYMKITIFTLIGMIRLIGFNIHDIQIHVNIQFWKVKMKFTSY